MFRLCVFFTAVWLAAGDTLYFQPKGVKDIACDDKTSCPEGSTCCPLPGQGYGCCPLPKAVCCSDHQHCCPAGHKCDVSAGTCLTPAGGRRPWVLRGPAKALSAKAQAVICPGGQYQCPNGQTCCQQDGGSYACCPFNKATCCSDRSHCCPQDYKCDLSHGTCVKLTFRLGVRWQKKLSGAAKVLLGKMQEAATVAAGATTAKKPQQKLQTNAGTKPKTKEATPKQIPVPSNVKVTPNVAKATKVQPKVLQQPIPKTTVKDPKAVKQKVNIKLEAKVAQTQKATHIKVEVVPAAKQGTLPKDKVLQSKKTGVKTGKDGLQAETSKSKTKKAIKREKRVIESITDTIHATVKAIKDTVHRVVGRSGKSDEKVPGKKHAKAAKSNEEKSKKKTSKKVPLQVTPTFSGLKAGKTAKQPPPAKMQKSQVKEKVSSPTKTDATKFVNAKKSAASETNKMQQGKLREVRQQLQKNAQTIQHKMGVQGQTENYVQKVQTHTAQQQNTQQKMQQQNLEKQKIMQAQKLQQQQVIQQQKLQQLKIQEQIIEKQKLKQQILKQQRLERQNLQEERRLEQQRLIEQKLQQQKLQQQKLEQQRLQQQRLQEQKLQQQKLQQQKLEQQRLQQQKLQEEKLQKLQQQKLQEEKLQQQKIQQEKLEQQRLQQKKLEQQKLQEQKLQQQKLQQQKLQQQKLQEQKLQQQKLEQQRLQQKKLEQQKLQEQKLQQQKLQQQKLQQQKLQEQKLQQQKLEQQKLKQQKLEQQKLNQQKLQQERLQQQKLQHQKQQIQEQKLKQQKLEQQKLQQQKLQQQRLQEQKLQQQKIHAQNLQKQKEQKHVQQTHQQQTSQRNIKQKIKTAQQQASQQQKGKPKQQQQQQQQQTLQNPMKQKISKAGAKAVPKKPPAGGGSGNIGTGRRLLGLAWRLLGLEDTESEQLSERADEQLVGKTNHGWDFDAGMEDEQFVVEGEEFEIVEEDGLEMVAGVSGHVKIACPDKSTCPDGTTCCQLATGQYGCCPMPKAVCCSDHIHCCPDGQTCDVKAGSCNAANGVTTKLRRKFPSTVAEESSVTCPGGTTECPSGSTCCRIKGDVYGCCPLPNAVCCSDNLHCCPQGYTCSKGNCVKGNLAIPWMVKTPAKPKSDGPCPGGSCPSGSTCCRMAGDIYDCCPLPNAVCCGNKWPSTMHCCPQGHTCGETCIKGNLAIPWLVKTPSKPKSAVTCPGGSMTCPSGSTSCRIAGGTYACCPLPNVGGVNEETELHDKAVCCSDNLHCCPQGYTCSKGNCVKGNLAIPWMVKTPSKPKSVTTTKMVCPDKKSTCPGDTTCCLVASGGYGCCPLPSAVCCADKEHCCPQGYVCAPETALCIQSTVSVPFSMKQPARTVAEVGSPKLYKDIICPDQRSMCPDESTCCQMASGAWGCCPMPNAICCSDHQHCCPSGTKCDVAAGMCTSSSSSLSVSHTRITPRSKVNMAANQATPKHSLTIVKCEDETECPDGDTCCVMSSGKYACCPHNEATCCPDKQHCCPKGFTCGEKADECKKGSMTVSAIFIARLLSKSPSPQAQAQVMEIKCADSETSCPTGNTCCAMEAGGYGCCALPNAVCCKSGSCCPSGHKCDATGTRCIVSIPWMKKKASSPTTAGEEKTLPQACPNTRFTCAAGNTCCQMKGDNWGCCASPDAVCCKNGPYCCPKGLTCSDQPGQCLPAAGSESTRHAATFLQRAAKGGHILY